MEKRWTKERTAENGIRYTKDTTTVTINTIATGGGLVRTANDNFHELVALPQGFITQEVICRYLAAPDYYLQTRLRYSPDVNNAVPYWDGMRGNFPREELTSLVEELIRNNELDLDFLR